MGARGRHPGIRGWLAGRPATWTPPIARRFPAAVGYWALRTLDDLIGRFHNVWRLCPSAVPGVIGKVALWGKVVVGERGYRSSCAYPRELFVAGGVHPWAEQCAVIDGLRSYGVSVRTSESLGLVFDQARPWVQERNRRFRQEAKGRSLWTSVRR